MTDVFAGPRRRGPLEIEEELPEALDRLAADLRGGGTILSALEGLAGGTGPLAQELAPVVRRSTDGGCLVDALARWPAGRPAVAAAAVALEVAASVGGQAATALEGLGRALRDRRRLGDEVAALTAQARWSAAVVGLGPVGGLVVFALIDPRIPAVLAGTPAGRACLVTGVGLEVLAAWWMSRLLSRSGSPRDETPALLADVLAMALGAGLNPYLAVMVATRTAPAGMHQPLARILDAVAGGARLADALDAAATADPALADVLRIVAASERTGAPVGSALGRVATAARDRALCSALARARTLPVRLLFPLVFLVLPAFVVLTVVPVLLVGWSGGLTPASP